MVYGRARVKAQRVLWFIPLTKAESQSHISRESADGNLTETHDCCTKDTIRGSLTVNNLLMALNGGFVTQIAANEAQ